MSFNHALCLCFLCESQSTLQRKRNIAIPIWSGWFPVHRFSYYTTQSPQEAVTFLSSALAMKRIAQRCILTNIHQREKQQPWSILFQVASLQDMWEDVSCSPNTCIFFWIYLIKWFFFPFCLAAHLPGNWKWLEISRKMGVGGKQGKKRIFTCGFKYFPDLSFQSWRRKRRSLLF